VIDNQALKDSLLRSLSLLPETTLVGLVTLGTNVNLYDLSFAELPKSYVFRGDRDIKPQVICRECCSLYLLLLLLLIIYYYCCCYYYIEYYYKHLFIYPLIDNDMYNAIVGDTGAEIAAGADGAERQRTGADRARLQISASVIRM
jgi:hypothetical protein